MLKPKHKMVEMEISNIVKKPMLFLGTYFAWFEKVTITIPFPSSVRCVGYLLNCSSKR